MAPIFGPQKPAQETTRSARDRVLLRARADAYAGDPATGLLDPDHLGAAAEDRPGALAAPDQQLHRPGRQRESVGGCVVAAEDLVAVQQGVQSYALVRVDQPGVDPPGLGPTELALQVLQPGRCGGDLQSTDLVEARLAVGRQAEELLHGVAGEQGHRAGRVGLVDQTRGVRGGTTRGGQRPLLDDGDVGPAAADQLVRQVGADDAGTDDHHTRAAHDRLLLLLDARYGQVSGRPRCWSRYAAPGAGRASAPPGTGPAPRRRGRRWPARRDRRCGRPG